MHLRVDLPGTGDALVAGMWKMALAAATTHTAIRADHTLHDDCEMRHILAYKSTKIAFTVRVN